MNAGSRSKPNLTTHALLELAKDAGYEVSGDQLKRWSRRGLLPRATQQQRLGKRGSETVWPVGSDAQLLGICQLLARFSRRHDALLLAVWWDQWPVDDAALLETLSKQIAQLPAARVDRAASEEERLDAVDDLVASFDPRRLRGPVGKVIRRASKNDIDRRSLAWAICAIAYGVDLPLESADVGIDERSIGDLLADGLPLRRFAHQVSEVGEPVRVDELVRNIASLAGQIEPMLDHAQSVIAAGDVAELARARDQARSLMKVAAISGATLPIDPTNGLGLIGELIPTDDDPDIWTFILVSTLWQRHTMPDALESITGALDKHSPSAEAFAVLLDGVPGFRDAHLEAGGDETALAVIAESRPELRAALDSFLAEHPHVAMALDPASDS